MVVLDVDHADRLVTLGPDDVLIVTKLDRLARSSRDLLNIVSQITEVGASFKSLRDQWADTTTPTGRMILTVLSGIAEFERELINERTGEGRTRARERRSVRPAFEAVDVPASRSFTTERSRRAGENDRAELRRPSFTDLAAEVTKGGGTRRAIRPPERRLRGGVSEFSLFSDHNPRFYF